MFDKKTQMMDAGMALFVSPKSLGTVIGGVMVELRKSGKVLRRNDIDPSSLPESTGDCELFLDWSTPMRWRYVSATVEDAGEAGTNAEGEPLRRYAVSFKEGNRNKAVKKAIVYALAAAILALGITGIKGVPGFITVILALVIDFIMVMEALKPSVEAQKRITSLLSIMKEAK